MRTKEMIDSLFGGRFAEGVKDGEMGKSRRKKDFRTMATVGGDDVGPAQSIVYQGEIRQGEERYPEVEEFLGPEKLQGVGWSLMTGQEDE